MSERLFRQRHPVFTGLLVLGAIMLFFWGGITFFVSSLTRPSQAEIFSKEGIGVIDIKGVIVESEEIIGNLITFRDDAKVKAIVLRVDSPGGTVGASQEIYEEVRRTNETKPVVASMGSVAASGGLYVSLGAAKVVANAGTLTGSMGVIFKFANLEGLFEKIGYKSEVVKSGRLKDIGSSSRPMTEEERQMLQGLIDVVHGQFVQAAVESRSVSEEEVRKIADGRIFSGQQAKEYGLVDQLGNFTDAVMLAARLAGLKEEGMPQLIYPEEEDFSLLRLMTGKKSQSLLQQTAVSGPALAYEWTGTLR
ncbi:signal peptide peptidase SppA [Thiovibrio sp. JS02]